MLDRLDPVALPLQLPVGDSTPTGTGGAADVLKVDDALRPTCGGGCACPGVWVGGVGDSKTVHKQSHFMQDKHRVLIYVLYATKHATQAIASYQPISKGKTNSKNSVRH